MSGSYLSAKKNAVRTEILRIHARCLTSINYRNEIGTAQTTGDR
jgi:hypothetical protein